ncbi:MAG TPA: apolipoprotein N-acyltransferase [Thermoanaerobaculia bacterium]|nr:apolipoprotein N-acyltransferase [Thermoanaerobaculia bacterium]
MVEPREEATPPQPGERAASGGWYPWRGWSGALWWGAAALGTGAVWGLCFQARPRPLLALVALAPLLGLLLAPGAEPAVRWPVRSWRRCFTLGWLHGLGCWLASIPWIAGVLRRYGELPAWLALVLLVVLCAYLGVYHGVFALLARSLLASGRAVWIALALPGAWVGLEWLRSVLLTGFPWNLAAYAWVGVPGALPASAWVGSYGISFLVVLVQVAVVQAARLRSARPLLWAAPAAALLAAAAWATPPVASVPEGGVPVRVVQPNIGIEDASPEAFARLLELSVCPPQGGLLVWPESAAWPRSWQGDAPLRSALLEIAADGCEALINTTRWEGEHAYNAAMLIGPQGERASYDKVHLVPFGEYVPFAGLFPFLDEIARNAGGYDAASEVVTLPWGDEELGVAICFEITLPSQVALLVARGATVLVTLTNDAWYGDTSAPRQHFVAARFRAAENRRPLLRAAITGISAVIDPWGRPLTRLGVGETGVLDWRIVGRETRTPYSRFPWLTPTVAAGLAALGLARTRGGTAADGRE